MLFVPAGLVAAGLGPRSDPGGWCWLAALTVGYHLFVTHEAPTLHHLFGDAYARYCAAVPRWLLNGVKRGSNGL